MFQEILVTDYIADYSKLTTEQISSIASQNLRELNFLENCPNGTVIGIIVSQRSDFQRRVFYPFFSHINMPVKPGERAWIFDPGKGRVGYWVTRKVQNTSANDLNFTNDDSARLYSALGSDANKRIKVSGIFYDSKTSGASISSVKSSALSSQDFIGEPVSPVEAKCTDVVLQGSNNAAIKIGNQGSEGTGTIDLVAGLASNSLRETVTNTSGYDETIKPPLSTDVEVSSFGILSADDEARVTISRSFNSDEYYTLTGDDAGSQSTVSLKADGIRIVAKNDLKIVVGDSADPASIIIKNDGSIILTPSSAGYLKLGGDDATAALLVSPDAVSAAGTVTGVPIVSTAGGVLGLTGQSATGVFSSKILVKV